MRTWIVDLVDSGLKNTSVNRKLSSLRRYFDFLIKIEVISINPMQGHKSLKKQKRVNLPFSQLEVVQVFEKMTAQLYDFSDYRDFLIVDLLYSCGLRRSELISLVYSDVSFISNELRVKGKGGKVRFVPLMEITLEYLEKYFELYRENWVLQRDSSLFVTDKGLKIYDNFVFRLVNLYFGETTTKKKVSPHIIRHSFATHLLDSGAQLNDIKMLLGHSSLAATQVYTHNDVGRLLDVYRKAHPRDKK